MCHVASAAHIHIHTHAYISIHLPYMQADIWAIECTLQSAVRKSYCKYEYSGKSTGDIFWFLAMRLS